MTLAQLKKYAAQNAGNSAEMQHEQTESPAQETAEHAPGGYEQGGEGMSVDALEKLIAQLSPEEMQELMTHISGGADEATPEQPEAGDHANIAQAIEQHLSENPEAQAPDTAPPEKAAALKLVKSAAYIEGFLDHAAEYGLDVKTAVDMYDQSLAEALHILKTSELKGNQHKLDVDGDGKIEASDLRKLRAGKKHESAESAKEEKLEHAKQAAYIKGLYDHATSQGFSRDQVNALLKSAGVLDGKNYSTNLPQY